MRCMYSIFSRDLPYIQSYTVCIHSFGHPYKYVLQLMRVCSGRPSLSVLPLHPKRHCQVSHLHIRAVNVPFILCVSVCVCMQDAPPCQCCPCTPNVIAKSLTYTFVPLMCLSSCVCVHAGRPSLSVLPLHPKRHCQVTHTFVPLMCLSSCVCVCMQDAPPCQCCPCTSNFIAKSLTYTFVPLMCLSSCVCVCVCMQDAPSLSVLPLHPKRHC